MEKQRGKIKLANSGQPGLNCYGEQHTCKQYWQPPAIAGMQSGGQPLVPLRPLFGTFPTTFRIRHPWLQCLRSRKACNAPIEAGYDHCVPALMATRALDTGVRQVDDAEKREFRDG